VGADRKGPLVAFIVVAIIAAILLITSVRSQAATGWLGRAVPSAPGVVHAVGGGLDRVTEQGSGVARTTTGLLAPSDSDDATARVAHAPVSPSWSGDRPTTEPGTRATTRPGRHLGRAQLDHGHAGQFHPDHGRELGRREHQRGVTGQSSAARVATTESSGSSPTR
jgi:hypothetical protein